MCSVTNIDFNQLFNQIIKNEKTININAGTGGCSICIL